MLGVVEALNKYRHFLLGRHFIIKSDHLSLRFINSLKDSSVGRLFRWSLQIQGFDFEWIYIKGSLHTVADSLSRRDYPVCTDPTMDKLFLDQTVHVVQNPTQTLPQEQLVQIGKRMSYLLRHGAKFEGVSITSQGYIAIPVLIKWLRGDTCLKVMWSDITFIVEHDLKGRFKVNTNGEIQAVNAYSCLK